MRVAALAAVAVAGACSPVTTRPPFAPLPRAVEVLLAAEPQQVTVEAASWLRAQRIPLQRTSEVDRYIETGWYPPPADTTPVSGPTPAAVKTRIWADPAGPGRTRLTVETVYHEVEDPSRTPRDLDLVALPGTPGRRLGDRLITALTTKFGAL